MEWLTERFGDVCDFVRGPFGGSLKKNIFREEGYAVYEQQHAIYDQFESIRYFVDEEKFSEMCRFELFAGDLIMSCSGTMGRIAIVPPGIPRGIINKALLKLTPRVGLSPEYLKFWMESRNFQEQIESLSQGAAIKNMASVKILKEIKVPAPSEDEQKRIVAILDQVFADIEQARAKTEQNLKNAHELFESYLQQVFSHSGVDWEKTNLGKVTGGIYTGPFGSLLHKRDYIENGIPLVNPVHITRLGVKADYRKTVSQETAQRLANYIMCEGDIVIARRGEMGRCALITEGEEGFLCGTGSFFIKRSVRCDGGYLVRYLRSEMCKSRLEKIAGGAVMPNLSNRDLSNLSLYLPPLSKQKDAVEAINEVSRQTESLVLVYQKKLLALDELKKSILQKAFSGELTKAQDKNTAKGVAA